MAGELFLKMKELQIFKPTVMDTVINEFEPDDGQFVLTDAFLPMKMVSSLDMIDMVKFGAFGRTYPVNLNAQHARIDLPGWTYRQYGAGHWREGVMFNEDVLLNAMNPQSPLTRMGEDLVTEALNLLDLRLNNLIERVTLDTIIGGFYSEARWGVNYEYLPIIPPNHYLDITLTTATNPHCKQWGAGVASVTWDTIASSTPLDDIKQAVQYFRKIGYETTTIWMNDITACKIENSADFKAALTGVPNLLQANLENESFLSFIANLKGQKIRIDSRMYREDSKVVQAAGASDTTVVVENGAIFKIGDDVIIKYSDGTERWQTLAAAPVANIITFPAAIGKALTPGDRLITTRKLFPTNYVIFEGRKSSRVSSNNWISTPSLVKTKSYGNPQPGRYTWSHFDTDRPPFSLEVGAGISGGPKVGDANWLVLYVGAGGSTYSPALTAATAPGLGGFYWKNQT
jgi:hypothetical protein